MFCEVLSTEEVVYGAVHCFSHPCRLGYRGSPAVLLACDVLCTRSALLCSAVLCASPALLWPAIVQRGSIMVLLLTYSRSGCAL
jgi:hypothetical protein